MKNAILNKIYNFKFKIFLLKFPKGLVIVHEKYTIFWMKTLIIKIISYIDTSFIQIISHNIDNSAKAVNYH